MSEKDQEQHIVQQINELRDILIHNIDEFRDIVLSARPQASEANNPNYVEQRNMYCDLLRTATGLMANMETTINDLLTEFQFYIDDLWNAICADKDPSSIVREFQLKVATYMRTHWDPIFARADEIIANIEAARQHT